jgi:hypothetical protein
MWNHHEVELICNFQVLNFDFIYDFLTHRADKEVTLMRVDYDKIMHLYLIL